MNPNRQRSLNAGWIRHQQVTALRDLQRRHKQVEVQTLDGTCYTGTLWYQGRMMPRAEMAATINTALDLYAACPSNDRPVREQFTVHDGVQGYPVAFWQVIALREV